MARAERANTELNAVCTWVGRSSSGPANRPFAGVPTAIKDNEDLAGYPTSWGSRAVPDQPARASSPFVEQFLQLGLAPIAKTTLPEFGFTASAESSRFGATGNPWDTRRSAGGSSGGSAALVGAGVVPLAHGNDGGGSIRIPAAACGLVGLKTSRGRIIDRPEEARMPVSYKVAGRAHPDGARHRAVPGRGRTALRQPRPAAGRARHGSQPAAAAHRGDRQQPDGDPDRCGEPSGRTRRRAGVRRPGPSRRARPPVIDHRFCPDLGRYFCLMAFLMQHAGGRMLGAEFLADRTDPLLKGMSSMAARSVWQVPASLRRLRRLAAAGEEVFDRCDVLLVPSAGHETPRSVTWHLTWTPTST